MPKREVLDLHEMPHPECRKCPRRLRKQNTGDGQCKVTVSVLDGGPVRCVGRWSRDKIHFLTQYFGIFGKGMKDIWEGNVHYVEVCSGPGRCIERDSATELDGTAVAIMEHPSFPYFKTATFLDRSPDIVQSLNKRISARNANPQALALEADYFDPASLCATVQRRASLGLSLVFIDPTDCSVPFETVAAIAHCLPNVDLIINVALGTDATRNIKPAILNDDSRSRSKYASFLGGDAFFHDKEVLALAETGRDEALRIMFREYYRGALGSLGYKYFDTKMVEHYYDLLFASRHPRGLEFWQKAQKYGPDNQATFGF